MTYDLSYILDRERFKRRCNTLYETGQVVELTAKRSVRTLPQNSYLHLILGWFAQEMGYRIEFVKSEYFKRYVNPDIFLVHKNVKFLGKVETLKSSKELTTAEMTTAIERFRNWSSSEAGIYLPAPNETDFLDAIKIEIDRNKEYL